VLVGHDIGAMVAVAYALQYRHEVSHLVVVDAPLPGTTVFDRMRGDPRGWHAAFHSARDIAELLVMGRERAYLHHMIEVRIFDPSAISSEDFEVYVRAYEAPGAMRAAFELYRSFDQDASNLVRAMSEHGKLAMPTLAIGGEISGVGPLMLETVQEIAEKATAVTVPGTGHWVPEENPEGFCDAVTRFVISGE
jgi:pimeloyl-ACP methyl ester carboxylesterase